jgi:hypothetical protein
LGLIYSIISGGFCLVKVLYRMITFKPRLVGDDIIRLYLLDKDESWRTDTIRMSKHILDRLLAYANNIVVTNPIDEGYVFAEAEIPGLKAFVGEGGFREAETVLSPIPQPVTSIKLYRFENDKPVLIHEYKPPSDTWVYESKIIIDPSIKYDLIILETPEGPRPVYPEETYMPQRKTLTSEKRGRKKRRRGGRKGRRGRRKRRKKRKR